MPASELSQRLHLKRLWKSGMDITPLCIHSSLINCFSKVIFLRFCNKLNFHILSRDGKCSGYHAESKSQFCQRSMFIQQKVSMWLRFMPPQRVACSGSVMFCVRCQHWHTHRTGRKDECVTHMLLQCRRIEWPQRLLQIASLSVCKQNFLTMCVKKLCSVSTKLWVFLGTMV